MTRIYGIANCDKVKKAKNWLEKRDIPYEFQDFRKDGLTADTVTRWYNIWQDSMINRRSTTWRNLSENEQRLTSKAAAIELLVKYPTLIQRPVLESNHRTIMNFSEAAYADFFNKDAI